jgi:aminoglycoside N3'-acetyltransferase
MHLWRSEHRLRAFGRKFSLDETVNVTRFDIAKAIEYLGLSGSTVCLHASLRSFGYVDGGPDTVIDAFLDAGCTLLMPTFSGSYFEVAPEAGQLLPRNGWDYVEAERLPRRTDSVYSPDTNLIERDMGAIAAALVDRPNRIRGNHPLDSFSAVGPLASDLIEEQSWNDVYAPLRELAKLNGYVVLAGVGLNRMTILHLAEALSGRRLFRRWATGPDGDPVAVPAGGCSEGFPNLEPVIGLLATETMVGQSRWRVFPAAETVTTGAAVIRTNPRITHCNDEECVRCPDAVAGGPEL